MDSLEAAITDLRSAFRRVLRIATSSTLGTIFLPVVADIGTELQCDPHATPEEVLERARRVGADLRTPLEQRPATRLDTVGDLIFRAREEGRAHAAARLGSYAAERNAIAQAVGLPSDPGVDKLLPAVREVVGGARKLLEMMSGALWPGQAPAPAHAIVAVLKKRESERRHSANILAELGAVLEAHKHVKGRPAEEDAGPVPADPIVRLERDLGIVS
jgi:hypothetical protein